MAKTTYYSFERLDGDGFDGLIRFDGVTPAKAVGGAWIVDGDLARRIRDPGADGPQAIDGSTAQKLAHRYGVEL